MNVDLTEKAMQMALLHENMLNIIYKRTAD